MLRITYVSEILDTFFRFFCVEMVQIPDRVFRSASGSHIMREMRHMSRSRGGSGSSCLVGGKHGGTL
jgi:hypothetical protein